MTEVQYIKEHDVMKHFMSKRTQKISDTTAVHTATITSKILILIR